MPEHDRREFVIDLERLRLVSRLGASPSHSGVVPTAGHCPENLLCCQPLRAAGDITAMTILETLRRDVGLAARRLVRTPGFTLIAVISLALGVGVNTLMFSFMNAVLLQPLPYPKADRLVMIYLAPPNNPGMFGMLT